MTMRTIAVLITLAALVSACTADTDQSARATAPLATTAIDTTTGRTGDPDTSSSSTNTTPRDGATDAPADNDTVPSDVATEPPVGSDTVTSDTAPGETSVPDEPAPTVGEPSVAAEAIGEFDEPVDLAVRDDDSMYIVEQPGRIVRVAGGDTDVVADLTDRVASGGERGLLGLAFSPGDDLAYVNYTDGDGDTVIAEFPVTPDGVLDVDGEREVLRVDQPYRNHNAGDLAFGPDRLLYIPLGDGGSGGDPERRASDPSSFLGSMLRIDPTPEGDNGYSIPPDNPFASGGGGAPEVWAWGLRNPWRVAFDPVTSDLWIADVGQNEFEEINHVTAAASRGANFGWSAFEGTQRFNDDVGDPGDTVMPVFTYDRSEGCSISGGAPYRGSAIAELEPAYVYSDFCSGTVWAFDPASGRNIELLDGFDSVSAVRAGPDGELYILELAGTVHKVVP